jgi:hypothetical protein
VYRLRAADRVSQRSPIANIVNTANVLLEVDEAGHRPLPDAIAPMAT